MEAFKMARLLDGLTLIDIHGKLAMQYVRWCGKNPEIVDPSRVWGEVGQ
jgi:hypothetical protein